MGRILYSSKSYELWNIDYLETLRNRLENSLDYTGMGLGLSDLSRSSSVPIFFTIGGYVVIVVVLFLGKDLLSLRIHILWYEYMVV